MIDFAYDAAALQGVFNNAAIALAIVAVVLLVLWVAEYKLRQLLELVAWSAIACAAIAVVTWLGIAVWWD
ncbi:hypothetical protein [Bradyrhizobium sp. th.b2]|uniref:hypothetical protein n=1 Tax=Bradyrhizobium sp. th-b2 TaxID=172088 RepID=UPI0004104F4C|nr:hypothetical protein [Bradyrhizobium sp. th.b2]